MSSHDAKIQSAVSFLRDPSVQDAPLARKLAFLTDKGLNEQEIQTALQLAGSSSSAPGPSIQNQPYYAYQQYPGQRQPPDWRDYFIMTVVAGGVGTVLYSLARKYLLPALAPPSQTELQAAQDALTAKYDEAAAILSSLQTETEEIKSTLKEQCAKVDESVEQVTSALGALKVKEDTRDEEIEHIKEEVDALKGLVEKMFDKHKDAQTASLNDIQQEVKSLKSLFGGRAGPSTSSSPPPGKSSLHAPAPRAVPTYSPSGSSFASSGSRFGVSGGTGSISPSPSFPHLANRAPGIPAWQMQSSTDKPSASSSAAAQAAEQSGSSDESNRDEDKDTPSAAQNGVGSEYEEVKRPEAADADDASNIPA